MSELHSETNDSTRNVTVRVKLVNLNHTRVSSPTNDNMSSARVSKESLSALVGLNAAKAGRPRSSSSKRPKGIDRSGVEICMLDGDRIPVAEFETHIETCSICANRVELQLDFMETLEVAVYQRLSHPESTTVKGAMLISAPELNFAVCGELEIG